TIVDIDVVRLLRQRVALRGRRRDRDGERLPAHPVAAAPLGLLEPAFPVGAFFCAGLLGHPRPTVALPVSSPADSSPSPLSTPALHSPISRCRESSGHHRAPRPASRTPSRFQDSMFDTPAARGGGTSSSGDRSQALPSLPGIVMSLHKLSAGRGYDYLLQQVA